MSGEIHEEEEGGREDGLSSCRFCSKQAKGVHSPLQKLAKQFKHLFLEQEVILYFETTVLVLNMKLDFVVANILVNSGYRNRILHVFINRIHGGKTQNSN